MDVCATGLRGLGTNRDIYVFSEEKGRVGNITHGSKLGSESWSSLIISNLQSATKTADKSSINNRQFI